MKELVSAALAKAVVYNLYVLWGFLVLITLLLLFTLWRQRKVKKLTKLVTANFENLRVKFDEATAANKRMALDGTANLTKLFKEMQGEQNRLLTEVRGVSTNLDHIGSGLREQTQDLAREIGGLARSGGGASAEVLADIAGRLEDLADEMAWSHHYYDQLRTLEVAVEKLVGPEKMRQLIAGKEKGAGVGAREEFVRKSNL